VAATESSAEIYLTEIFPNPAGGDEGEWIEIFNAGKTRVNLAGWSLDDSEGGSKPYIFSETFIEPNSYYVVKRQISKIILNNTSDSARLFDPGGTLIARATYEKVLEGETLARDKVSLNSEALDLFVSRLPKERGVARMEIERLILFLGPGSGVNATAADLTDFLGVEPEASLGDAAIDAFGGRLGAAQAGLRRAAAEGEGGPAAVRAMGYHLGRLRRTLTLHKNGIDLTAAAKASGVFWKQEREFLRQARAWTLELLLDIQGEILNADRACKTSGSPDQLISERLALMIAGRARRLGL